MVLSRIGIGAATVDTVLERDVVRPGETIDAHIEIDGGSTDQDVDEVYLQLATKYRKNDDTFTTTSIRSGKIAEQFTIEAGEHRRLEPSPIHVPLSTPATIGRTEVWIDTGLDVDWALDPSDTDPLEVRPRPYLQAVLEAADRLGFEMKDAKPVTSGSFGPEVFVQEIEYAPTRGYRTKFEEIELFPVPREDGLDLAIEIDRAGRTVGTAEETQHRLRIESTDTRQVTDELRAFLKRNR